MPNFNVLVFLVNLKCSCLSVLILVLIHSCSNKLQFVYLTSLFTWPVEKARNFPFLKGKKETAHHYWVLFLKSISRLLRYKFLFLTENNLSFTIFLICSYFFTHSEFRCCYKVCSYKKKEECIKFYVCPDSIAIDS